MKQKPTNTDDETTMMNNDTVIGLFRLRGTTLLAWCKQKGVAYSTVQLAILGHRKGPKSRQVVRMVREELGL